MTIQEAADSLGITVEALFQRAYQHNFGLATSPSGSTACDYAWWKKWGTPPIYVTKFVRSLKDKAAIQQAMN